MTKNDTEELLKTVQMSISNVLGNIMHRATVTIIGRFGNNVIVGADAKTPERALELLANMLAQRLKDQSFANQSS